MVPNTIRETLPSDLFRRVGTVEPDELDLFFGEGAMISKQAETGQAATSTDLYVEDSGGSGRPGLLASIDHARIRPPVSRDVVEL